jgi:hypothetical protein
MFRREAHQRLAPVLAAFDVQALESYRVALGGATRIALAFGEVRVSRDVDLLCSDAAGWARLRTAVSERGYAALFEHPETLVLPRLPTTDQYGVRFVVGPPEAAVKVELIREARIELAPSVREPFCALPCLALDDVFTEKLLANADRGDDPSQLDRDLIDLALLRSKLGPVPSASFDAAQRAYGPSARAALTRVLATVHRDPERLARDLRGLAVDDVDVIRAGLASLATDLGLSLALDPDA